MTRVVVPRSNAPASSRSASTSTSSAAPPEDPEHPAEQGAPVEAEPESSSQQLIPRLSSLRVEDSKSSDSEAGKEPQAENEGGAPLPASIEVTNPQHSSGTSSLPRAGASSRRSSFSGSSRPVFPPQRVRTSPTSSHSTSPKAHAVESDGYNSADESGAWSSAAPVFEEDEDKENRFEVELRRVKGYEVKRMVPDGNCLFRAVADQVYGDPEMYAETRHMCIDYMERERDHFSQFVTESFTAYCKRKRKDKVYGNNLEIQAMAEMYNRPIHIYMYNTDPSNTFHGQYETDLPPIRLSYHKRNHYNSLRDPTRPAIGAGLGFGSLRGSNVDGDQVKAAIRAQQDQQIENALVAEGRYYSDLELTEQEIERMVMEASRAEYLAHRQAQSLSDETSSSAGGEPSSSGAASRGSGSGAGAGSGAGVGGAGSGAGSGVGGVGAGAGAGAGAGGAGAGAGAGAIDSGVSSRNKNVRLLLSMGFSYVRVMEAWSIFGDDVNNMLCYLLETDSLGENAYRMKGKAAEK